MHTLNTTFATVVATSTLTAALLGATPAHGAELQSRCTPQPIATPTDFPAKSQSRGEHGVVQLTLTLSADGRATSVVLAQSSGHKALDKAAVRSVSSQWQFDVAQCTAAQLAEPRTVDVTFVRAKHHTLTSAIDVKSITKIRALAANTLCQQTTDEVGTAIFSCLKPSAGNVTPNAAVARTP